MYFVLQLFIQVFVKIQNGRMTQDVKLCRAIPYQRCIFNRGIRRRLMAIASSDEQGLHSFLVLIQRKFYFTNADVKFSTSKTQPFTKWRVRNIKRDCLVGG